MSESIVVKQREDVPPIQNDLMLRVARGERVKRAPVWAMRQAGRYLPEFRALRAQYDFFEMCQTPDLAATVTLQPLERYPQLDGVVVFSDILIVPQAMGMECRMEPGIGPVFPQPVQSPDDLTRLRLSPNVSEFQYLFDAITLTRRRSEGKVPVIGFCGGPWTLMAYMIEGGGSRTYSKAKKWLYDFPAASHRLLGAITSILIELLIHEYIAGADILQVFESTAGELTPSLWKEFSYPYLKEIADVVRKRTPSIHHGGPALTVFARGAHYALDDLHATQYNTVSLDWTMDPSTSVAHLGTKTVQGNLDPCVLYASPEIIRSRVRTMLEGFKRQPLIANLGHGMHKEHDPEHFRVFLQAVHEESESLYKKLDEKKRLLTYSGLAAISGLAVIGGVALLRNRR